MHSACVRSQQHRHPQASFIVNTVHASTFRKKTLCKIIKPSKDCKKIKTIRDELWSHILLNSKETDYLKEKLNMKEI